MFNLKVKRCLASLMIAVMCTGVLCPSTISVKAAEITDKPYGKSSDVYSGLSAQIYDIPYYYGTGIPNSNRKMIKLYYDKDVKETFAWTSKLFLSQSNFKFNANWSKLNGDIVDSYTSVVLNKIDATLGVSIQEDNLMSMLNNLNQSQGASSPDITNLNQRMAAFLYVRLNPNSLKEGVKYKWDSISAISDSDYSDMLTQTLGLGHDRTLNSRLAKIGLIGNADESAIVASGKAFTPSYEYSISNLGVMSLDMQQEIGSTSGNNDVDSSSSNAAYSINNKVYLANEMALYICLCQYIDWYIDEMPNIASTAGWQESEEVKSKLTYLRIFNDAFGDLIPVVRKVYNLSNPEAQSMSISSMVDACGVKSSTIDEAFSVDISTYVKHTDTSTPITQFYTPNPTVGIVSYDRDTILADIEVDTRLDYAQEESSLQQDRENSTNGENNYYISNTFLATQSAVADTILEYFDVSGESNSEITCKDKHGLCEYLKSGYADTILNVLGTQYGNMWNESITTAIRTDDYDLVARLFSASVIMKLIDIASGNTNDIENYLNQVASSTKEELNTILDGLVDYGVDSNGKATSLGAVTINDYVTQGMAYSTLYIPMRTNLYSPDVVAQFKGADDSNDFYNFYIDYGFMRKALYMDTSATAAVDYYNTNGQFVGNLKICTLRDLIESGDNDIALYIDSGFYNADEAIEEGNRLLESTRDNRESLYLSLIEFQSIYTNSSFFSNKASVALFSIESPELKTSVMSLLDADDIQAEPKMNVDELFVSFSNTLLSTYKFNLFKFYNDNKELINYVDDLGEANNISSQHTLTDKVLKTRGYVSYSGEIINSLASISNSSYVNLSSRETDNPYAVNLDDEGLYTDDNTDTIVLTSSQINQFLSGEMTYSNTNKIDDTTEVVTTYTTDTGYSPMMSLAYVSCLYRDLRMYTLATAVESNNPVFLASSKLCGIKDANQWYRNTLLNYILLKNIKGNAQIDTSYVTDLDCPVYMDIFGNILTESGTVVIPAASNATLHAGSFKNYNYAIGIYSCYGKEYYVPSNLEGALSVLYPYFVIDGNSDKYVVNAITMNVGSTSVRFDKIDTSSDEAKDAIMSAYKAAVSSGKTTRYNWMAMVKIINEVMRGAPIESIDKEKEGLTVSYAMSGLVAAAKLEAMLKSLKGDTSNTLLYIPDFTKMDNMEVWIALLIKMMMVATAAVIIVSIYRDGVSCNLGLHTVTTSLLAVALTASCIVVIPSVFQLTYYSANKILLNDESMKILMVNEEKRQCGTEIGITEMTTVNSTGEFALQLDWVKIPWYRFMENMLYDSALNNLQQVKLEAYKKTAIYNNSDITMYNDGAYITTDDLFDSVSIDYTFGTSGTNRGLYLYSSKNEPQTASFYSPYYVFLRILTANVNEYNRWLNTTGNIYVTEDEALDAEEAGTSGVLGSYNYTVKYVSENRPKTVGLCSAYFQSEAFMLYDEDIMRMCQIYGATESDNNPATAMITSRETSYNRSLLFNDEDLNQMRASYWFNYDMIDANMDVYKKMAPFDPTTSIDKRQEYIASYLEDFYSRVDAMDNYAREFIADNKEMLGKVTDETFLKVMALSMAIKYNQMFGIPAASSLEIYNMSSEDLIRLCIVKSDEAVMATPMSYSRFVYTFGGEAGVYMAAVLSIVLWIGSFVKPLCTIIVFISVFLSIFIFRVVLRKPSANLIGYLVTVSLLCATNLLHAAILKIGVALPNFGLSTVGCLIFLIVGQVAYLLVLAYVTGVALKDWSNLGASEYEKDARLIKSRFKKESTNSKLSGKIIHHEDNWDYYNDLVSKHRMRNKG